MKIFTVFLSVFLLVPEISIAIKPVTQEHITGDAEAIPLQEKCQYFLKTGLENDNWSVLTKNGNDEGYTHGHLTHIIKRCDSGEDINIIVNSRLFTDPVITYRSAEGDIKTRTRFEEVNTLTISHTDWRAFNEIYKTAGLTIGHLSRNKMRLAGKEQELFHDSLSSLDYGEQDAKTGDTVTGIFEYEYLPEDKERTFVGGYIAVGKSYSLDNLREICVNQCNDYFRTEAGLEFISLKHGSNIYIFSEIEKSTLWDALSIFASFKAQRNEGSDGIYSEGSLGLKLRISQFQFHYLIKKRQLPHGGSQAIEYDTDEDYIAFVGIEIPLF